MGSPRNGSRCFMDSKRECDSLCVAYDKEDKEPCMLVKLVDTVQTFLAQLKRVHPEIKHPTSAPAPEVR